jgi:thiamine pyrophosphokinase
VRLVGSAAGPGELSIAGGPGDLVSLFPVDATVEDITTEGLRYPLRGESLTLGPSRGLSNELTGQTARVTIGRGRLLVVHTQGGGDER